LAKKKNDKTSSFGGVADLFVGVEDDENNAHGTVPTNTASQQSAFSSRAANTKPLKKHPLPSNQNSNQEEYLKLLAKYEEAQSRIVDLDRQLEEEKRRGDRLAKEVKKEVQLRQNELRLRESVQQELDEMNKRMQTQSIEQSVKKTEDFGDKKEKDDGDVKLGYLTFDVEKADDAPIHKRDPSFSDINNLFDDLTFNSDEELDEIVEKIAPETTEESGKDRHKRDPSFSGVIELFDETDQEELGIGKNNNPEINFGEMDGSLFDNRDDDYSDNVSEKKNHKRDPSYSGVKDLFEENSEEEMGPVNTGPVIQNAGTRTNNHMRDVSFGGVRELFAEEMPEEYSNQEHQIEDLRKKIVRYEEELLEHENLKELYSQSEADVGSLRQSLKEKTKLYDASKKREAEIEREMTELRQQMYDRLNEATSKGGAEIFQEELERRTEELKKVKEKVALLNTEKENLQRHLKGKDQEIEALKSTLTEERDEILALKERLKEAKIKTLNAEKELEIRKETTFKDDDHESKIEILLQRDNLDRQVGKLNKQLNDLHNNLEILQESKRKLAISACTEMDRLRGLFREMQTNKSVVVVSKAHTVQ